MGFLCQNDAIYVKNIDFAISGTRWAALALQDEALSVDGVLTTQFALPSLGTCIAYQVVLCLPNWHHSWARDSKGDFVKRIGGSRVLEAIILTRRDNGKFTLPGGFVLAGEAPSVTARRKLTEEALGSKIVSNVIQLMEHTSLH